LDRYKGLSAGVQSRRDPCPQRTNKRRPRPANDTLNTITVNLI